MDYIDMELNEMRMKKERDREILLKKCLNKLTDPELAYKCLALRIADRFEISNDYCGLPDSVYEILNYWIEEVDEDLESWLNKDDAPFIRESCEVNRIFPEFNFEKNFYKKLELINRVYGVGLYYDDDGYVYSYSFDFNSFTPLPIGEIRDLKVEISVLEKHGVDVSELRESLRSFGLSDDELELI